MAGLMWREGRMMETIFDYDPTPDELRYLAGPCSVADYHRGLTADEALTGLCQLFAMRGDRTRANAYADRISDRDFVRFTLQNGDLIAPSAATKRDSGAVNRSKAA
jgi:hypothetical protein